MKKLKTSHASFIILIIISLTLSGCSLVKPIEFKKVNNFKVEQKKGGARLLGNISLYNPNGFSYQINSVDISVAIEGNHIGKLVIPNKIEVQAHEEFKGDAYVDVSFTKAFVIGASILPKIKKGKVEVQLTGNASVSFLIFTKNIKLDKTEKIQF